MSKLLNKPFKAFTLYALLTLIGSIPVYYYVVDYIWIKELDEHNQIIKDRIDERLQTVSIEKQKMDTILKFWNIMQPGTTLVPSENNTLIRDSIYTVIRENKHGNILEKDRFRGLVAPVSIAGKHYRLTVETNVEETDETLLAIALVTFVFFSLLVIGFIVLNKKIAKGIWRPFQNTLTQLKAFDLTKHKNIQFEKSDIAEFEELNEELEKLIAKNITAYHLQKTFIENASHELQTPLAVLKSKTDLLLQNKDITSEQLLILNAINVPLSRVSRINKNLLLLAKIENQQFEDIETVNITAILDESIEMLADYITDKNIALHFQNKASVLISCNKSLLEILINNLLTNAIRHNSTNGNITITIEDGKLTFSNSGDNPLRQNTLFQRFSVSSSATTNSGLGLAIVKEICNRYHWQIVYSFEKNRHLFSVTF
ncbi:sensor histidine kinase [Flavobacterium sp. UBA4197]|uniref:sensor histidine kinase n=1 Tax=Flavobacterium sp. UBA4197 TaxID=1946546 RepID=UPI00257F6B85|nr:HAMP domain-containing sensor histidine kinase [Flavobacterium sp. UBA4197]